MSTDATQTDAPTPIDARQAAIDSIFSSRETQLKEEVGDDFLPQDNVVIKPDTEDDSALSDDDKPDDNPQNNHQEETKYKVKVDGEELELPITEIVKGYQKDQSASRRLEQAARERQALEQEREELYRQKQEWLNQQQTKHPPIDDKKDDVEVVKTLYQKLIYGGEEEGIEALNELLTGRNQKAIQQEQVVINEDEIVAKATDKALLQMQYKNAERQFLMDNPEIAGDATLFNIAMSVLDKAIPYSRTYDEAFTTAANETKAWLNKFSPKPDPVSEKVKRKQSMEVEPVKANAKAESFPEPKSETASEIIANMRKQRGLPQ